MNKINRAKLILQKVLECDCDRERGSSEYYVVASGKGEPRWIIPKKPYLARKVLAQWRPYDLSSRIKWYALRMFYSLHLMARLPGITAVICDHEYHRKIPGDNRNIVPVIYVGTPGPQQKAVVTLVDRTSGAPLAVMKVALGSSAESSLLREAEALELLKNSLVKDVPELLISKLECGRTWQTVVSGCLSSRSLTDQHIKWLLKLPKSGKVTTLNKQKIALHNLLESDISKLSDQQYLITSKAINSIHGQDEFSLLLAHGDFAPWNLKINNNKLAVIDWEDAELEGLPLWDLCHFYFIQKYLFNNSVEFNDFFSSQLIQKYRLGIGLDKIDTHILIKLYLCFKILTKSMNTSDAYKFFLINQLSKVNI